ncbi:MAG: hypothetical protein PF482_13545 [Desulfobacteraceae bacterium]|nr:hypothetical protein [Desulfobacteraceae bacterium]
MLDEPVSLGVPGEQALLRGQPLQALEDELYLLLALWGSKQLVAQTGLEEATL